MVASYVGEYHKHWDRHLPEFRFALNSAVHESTGVTPAELNLSRSLRGPMDVMPSPRLLTPDEPSYEKTAGLSDLKDFVMGRLTKARQRQKKNYDKRRRDCQYESKDRVWLRSHPYSKAEKAFSAKLAPKWQGPYRVVRVLGPLNYEIVREDTGEDLRTVHVCNIKPCYPSSRQLEAEEHQKRAKEGNEDRVSLCETGKGTPSPALHNQAGSKEQMDSAADQS